MSEFTLPANSKVGEGKRWPLPKPSEHAKSLQIYRWDPEKNANPQMDTFEAMGMAVFATKATRVTEEMFIVAAKAVAEQVAEENLASGLIYPPQSHILAASLHVAERVAGYIFDNGLARVPRPDNLGALIRARAYRPVYE
jgi:malic enzyme